MKLFLFPFLTLTCLASMAQVEQTYKYTSNETYTYAETHEVYRKLAAKHNIAEFKEIGESDAGKPIGVFIISSDKKFKGKEIRESKKSVLLINNAIHPGEPCGVDASVKFANDLLNNKEYQKLLDNTIVCITPFYNVGGGLNRSCCSRANQNGPEEYGFRGNTKNRDLNRDFIKCDTENSKAFTQIYHKYDPDVFIDTHTSNGSDHQHTMTLIASQPDKMTSEIRNLLRNKMLPYLYEDMKNKEMEMCPYVYNYKGTPDNGIKDYLDTPRYSTGYTTLFNTIGFVTEALKYKPYKDRVEQTYEFLLSALKYMNQNHSELVEEREKAIQSVINQKTFALGWHLDTASYTQIDFKGYEAEYIESDFGKNEKLLIYNHDKPYTKKINYYNRYTPIHKIEKPKAYIIPQAYKDVIKRLKWNKVKMERLKEDKSIDVEMYRIIDYKTVKQPYEGHYMHYEVKVEKQLREQQYYQGDYIIYVNQPANRYIVETLEPQGVDSYFAWNFFDGILQQKEWYSPFSFEETAKELLTNDNNLKLKFEEKKNSDVEFAKNRQQQLYFIYKNSPYYENTHNLYPVGRLLN